jgi:hypothetical protein
MTSRWSAREGLTGGLCSTLADDVNLGLGGLRGAVIGRLLASGDRAPGMDPAHWSQRPTSRCGADSRCGAFQLASRESTVLRVQHFGIGGDRLGVDERVEASDQRRSHRPRACCAGHGTNLPRSHGRRVATMNPVKGTRIAWVNGELATMWGVSEGAIGSPGSNRVRRGRRRWLG